MFKVYASAEALHEGHTHLLTCYDLQAAEQEATDIARLADTLPVIVFEFERLN